MQAFSVDKPGTLHDTDSAEAVIREQDLSFFLMQDFFFVD
jgi:hypothetical protein